ncbi:MAG: serine/threonine protein kinase [Kofleriaceae bacterium]
MLAGSTYPSTASSPAQLGRYELVRRLAIGGMAELFLAKATGINGFERMVVVKRILPHLAADSEFIRMFLQEARIAATLHHANVVQVHDIGKVEGTYFFTMEYVRGIDVQRMLNRAHLEHEPIPLKISISVILGAAAGLHYAHEQHQPNGEPLGIVHRDVSPSNLLVGEDGITKLVDFGIAKATLERHATRPGSVKGKLSYMSPEQCRGDPVDRRSDVFALGILLYELTTGSYLFSGANDFDVMQQVINGRIPPPSSRVRDYPTELERIVMRALEQDRDRRYATAEAMQRELERFAFEARLPISTLAVSDYVKGYEVAGPIEDVFRPEESLIIERTLASAAPSREQSEVNEWNVRTATAHAPPPITRRRSRWRVAMAAGGVLVASAGAALFVASDPDDVATPLAPAVPSSIAPPSPNPTTVPPATAPSPAVAPPENRRASTAPDAPQAEPARRGKKPARSGNSSSRRIPRRTEATEGSASGSAAPELVDPFKRPSR